jgi:hypothetical protein
MDSGPKKIAMAGSIQRSSNLVDAPRRHLRIVDLPDPSLIFVWGVLVQFTRIVRIPEHGRASDIRKVFKTSRLLALAPFNGCCRLLISAESTAPDDRLIVVNPDGLKVRKILRAVEMTTRARIGKTEKWATRSEFR